MPISVTCSCGKVFSVPDELAGRSGRCRSCGNPVAIPALVDPAGPGPVEVVSFAQAPPVAPPRRRMTFYDRALWFVAILSVLFLVVSGTRGGDDRRTPEEAGRVGETCVLCLVISIAGLACSRRA